MRLAAGLRPDPLGELKRAPRPLAAKRGPTSKGRGRKGREGMGGKGGEGRGGKRGEEREGKGGEGRDFAGPIKIWLLRPCKNICVPNSHHVDEQFACRVESLLHQNTHQTSDVDVPFVSIDSLCDCIQSLKLRKAAGHDGVTSEHIAFGGNDLAVHVCLLFNYMLRHS